MDCTAPGVAAAAARNPSVQQASPPPLAHTNAAYSTIPILWTGTAALLLGAVLVAALPSRGRSTTLG